MSDERTTTPPARIRSVERLIAVFCFAGVPLLIGAGILWHLSVWQVLSLALGLWCFGTTWMVRRHGIIGYSHTPGFDPQTGHVGPPTTSVVRAPLPRVLAPLLTILGFAFLLAGTRTSVGAVLLVPVVAGIDVWDFAKSAWELLNAVIIWAAIVAASVHGLLRHDRKALAIGGWSAGLLTFAVAANVVVYLIDDVWWREQWSGFFEPVKVVVRLFT